MRQTPNSIKNVTPYILANPVGVDGVIKDIQLHLSTSLPWLTKSFNRAVSTSRLNDQGDEVVSAKCWVNDGKDEFDMVANDNWDAYSFFTAKGKETPTEYSQFDTSDYERDIQLHFWFNLGKVDPLKTYDYLEELKQDILTSIRGVIFSDVYGVTLLEIEDDALQIFNDFTIDVTKKQLLYYPYSGLKFTFTARYPDLINCN